MEYYYALLRLVSISLFPQLLFAIIIFIIWLHERLRTATGRISSTPYVRSWLLLQVATSKVPEAAAAKQTLVVDNAKQEEKFRRHQVTNRLNCCAIVLVFIITVINMFITGFGIKLADSTTVIFSVETDQKIVGAAQTGQAIGG
ncbi:hypothetical protein PoB_007159200 [Plakobranchus ocellatus]|uniref:Uncharacterized protein n=1 Tax=Plakobranchus ocellatus TaxID=259542 RepID=A0AAV4DLD0_9GAST|nr:hypothetical protein PoB_007159200 [Plakobranchus ocellatus]